MYRKEILEGSPRACDQTQSHRRFWIYHGGAPSDYGDSITSFSPSLLPRSDTSPPCLAKSLPKSGGARASASQGCNVSSRRKPTNPPNQ
jgi:hypothetical protein